MLVEEVSRSVKPAIVQVRPYAYLIRKFPAMQPDLMVRHLSVCVEWTIVGVKRDFLSRGGRKTFLTREGLIN